jgi:signal transduction histidine kinase
MYPALPAPGAPRIDVVPFYRRLPTQLMLAAIIPIALASLLISLPLIEGRRTQLLAQELLRARQSVQTTELLAAERMRSATVLLQLLAERPGAAQPATPGALPQLQAYLSDARDSTSFDLLTVVDASGRVLAQDGDVALWRAEQPTDSTTVWGAAGVGLVVEVRAPIVPDGVSRGTLVGSFRLDRSLIAHVQATTDLEQSLIQDGRLLAASLPARAAVEGPLVRGGVEAPEALTVGGVRYLGFVTPLRDASGGELAALEVLVPLTPLRVAQQQATGVFIGALLVAATLASLLSLLLSRRITEPVSGLGRAAEAIGRGDLQRPVEERGPPEIRLLGRTLEWMRGQVAGAQTALAAEKARYTNLLESIDEAVVTLDADGAITSLNRSAERLLELKRADGLNTPLGLWLHSGAGQPLALEQIPLSGVGRLVVATSSGSAYTLEASRATFLPGMADGPAEDVIVLRDVSDEAALHALKERFLANVTHEFRTPLAALIASLEVLRDEDDSLTPAERAQLLDATQVGVRRLDSLVQNLLDGASLQAGYFRVEPEPCRLEPLVAEAVELMQPLIQQRAQTLEVAIPDDPPPVSGDGRRLVQVLVNLLSNASKFGPRGDTIVLETVSEGDVVRVRVSDHGPGVSPRRRPRLFDRFLRPGEETVAEQGVGLGLAIVRAIIERHGGEVRVEPAPTGTTTFSVTVRVAGSDGVSAAREELHEDLAG